MHALDKDEILNTVVYKYYNYNHHYICFTIDTCITDSFTPIWSYLLTVDRLSNAHRITALRLCIVC